MGILLFFPNLKIISSVKCESTLGVLYFVQEKWTTTSKIQGIGCSSAPWEFVF